VLDALRAEDRAGLSDDLEIVSIPARAWLAPYTGPEHHVDFPLDAVLSIVASLRSGDSIEVGTIGREGFLETDTELEADSERRGTFCQIAGEVARMPLERFRERMTRNASFARMMRRSTAATLFGTQQITACHARHRVQAQCARWLLATRDRVGRDALVLTHDSLAVLLGVRRASVSVALQSLQGAGAIVIHRGMVAVVSPARLRAASCECYEDCKEAYRSALFEPLTLAYG